MPLPFLAKMPRAKAIPTAKFAPAKMTFVGRVPGRLLTSGSTTNIGTTVPPVRQTIAERLPLGPTVRLPTARPLPEGISHDELERVRSETGQAIAEDPKWTARWQDSATPVGAKQRPWVKAYRWWVAGVHYRTWFDPRLYRIDFMWADHRHAYHNISRDVWENFRNLKGSVGQWFHQNILVAGWKPGAGARYPDFAL